MDLGKIEGPIYFERMTREGDFCWARTYSDVRRLNRLLRRHGFRWRGVWNATSMFDGMGSFGWRYSRAVWIQRPSGPEFAGRVYTKTLPPTEVQNISWREWRAARELLFEQGIALVIDKEGDPVTRDKVASAVAGLVEIVGPVEEPRRAPPDAVLERDAHLAHLAWMLGEIVPFYDNGRVEKAMRWLGYVQGACTALGMCTIGAMKNLNKPDEAAEQP
jgi:hypothetical protein